MGVTYLVLSLLFSYTSTIALSYAFYTYQHSVLFEMISFVSIIISIIFLLCYIKIKLHANKYERQ